MPSYKGLYDLKLTEGEEQKDIETLNSCVMDALEAGMLYEWLMAFVKGVTEGDMAADAAVGACLEWDF